MDNGMELLTPIRIPRLPIPSARAEINRPPNDMAPSLLNRVFFALLALSVISPECLAEEGMKQNNESQTMKTENAEIEIKIDNNCTVSHCPVRVEIRSIGPESVRLHMEDYGGEALSCKLKVTDRQGHACPYTQYGRGRLIRAIGNSRLVYVGRSTPLKFVIPLEKYFILTPGEWILECTAFLVDDQNNVYAPHLPPLQFSIPTQATQQ